jgi:hypothetical protein
MNLPIKQNNNNQSGYTVIEILIAMQLSFITFSIIYLNYTFINYYMVRLESRITDEIEYTNLSHNLTKQLTEIREVLWADPHMVTFLKSSNDTLRLQINGQLLMNGKNVFETSRLEGNFNYYISIGTRGNWTRNPTFREMKYIRAIQLSLEITKNSSKSRLKMTIRLLKRKPQIVSRE